MPVLGHSPAQIGEIPGVVDARVSASLELHVEVGERVREIPWPVLVVFQVQRTHVHPVVEEYGLFDRLPRELSLEARAQVPVAPRHEGHRAIDVVLVELGQHQVVLLQRVHQPDLKLGQRILDAAARVHSLLRDTRQLGAEGTQLRAFGRPNVSVELVLDLVRLQIVQDSGEFWKEVRRAILGGPTHVWSFTTHQ